MGSMTIEKVGVGGKRKVVRGRRRTEKAVEGFHEKTGWQPTLNDKQRKDLLKELKRKRSNAARLALLKNVHDGDVLDMLEKGDPKAATVIAAHRGKIKKAQGAINL